MEFSFAIDLLDHVTSLNSLVPIVCEISLSFSLDLFTVVPGPRGSIVCSKSMLDVSFKC